MIDVERTPNLADEIGRQSDRCPHAVAIFYPGGRVDFRTLDLLVWRVASRLRLGGVRPGDIVVHTFDSELLLLIGMLATARIGATVFSVPLATPQLRREEMIAALGGSARWMLSDVNQGCCEGLGRVFLGLDILQEETDNHLIDVGARCDSPSAPWLIILGSGSTGRPKLIPVTHALCMERMKLYGSLLDPKISDRVASLIHADFPSSKNQYLNALFSGASICLYDRKNTLPLDHCREYGITILYAVVVQLEQLLASLEQQPELKLTTLRAVVPAGSLISDSLRSRTTARLGPCLYVRYGTTETGPIADARPEVAEVISGTVGHALDGVSIQVVDERDAVAPTGSVGNIRIRSRGMVQYYIDDAEATAKAFRNGWFYPGDVGRMTQDGQLIFLGRADHMMIRDGINIYPAEIEMVMCRHPQVRDAAAVPFHHPVHQEVPVCGVSLTEGATVSEAELLAFAVERLGAHAPQRVVVLGEIPRNEQGKLVRSVLKARLEAIINEEPPLEKKNTGIVLGKPVVVLDMILFTPDQSSLPMIDQWLAEALDITDIPTRDSNVQSGVTDLAARVLSLATSLLRTANAPVFDQGRILQTIESVDTPGKWLIKVAMPQIELLPVECCRIALDGAAHVLAMLVAGQGYAQRNAEIFQHIAEKIIRPLSAMVPGGKSTIPVLRVAYQRNIPFTHLGAGIYQLGWGSRARTMDRSTTDWDSAHGSKLAQNKVWTANLVRVAGLPAPIHEVVSSLDQAKDAARRIGWPLVIKPSDCDRGEGVTVAIHDERKLHQAFDEAVNKSPSKQVLVEREVPGVCHRIFIAQGRLLYAVKRLPKSVFGDGQSTVSELIRKANAAEQHKAPWLRSEAYPADAAAVTAIESAGFSLESVPANGVRVPLRDIESTRWGGFDENVTDIIHPANLDISIRAAELFRLDVVGVDIISEDIRRPWYENGAIINEVNFAPLFGGGEISRRHIPVFFDRFLKGDGRIPVEVVVGGNQAMMLAMNRHKELCASGVRCFISSHRVTLDPVGASMPFPFVGVYRRCRALLLNRKVDAIILVLQTDEFLHWNMPIDRVTRIVEAQGDLVSWRNEEERVVPSVRHQLLGRLLACR